MKKILIIVSLLFLTGCNVLDGGNYEKNRLGFVQTDNILISYKTNTIGEIDLFMIDDLVPYLDALSKADYDNSLLSKEDALSSFVSQEELDTCNIEGFESIPRFIRLDDNSYYFKVNSSGTCTYDEYEFHKKGFEKTENLLSIDVSPIEELGITRFFDVDFTINSFESVLFIENISFQISDQEWVREIVTALPMSSRQEGDIYESNYKKLMEYGIIENYVLKNQSIKRLEVRTDYLDEEVFNIWSENTIDVLGRDHEIVKNVRSKQTKEILVVIEDTLGRLGLF